MCERTASRRQLLRRGVFAGAATLAGCRGRDAGPALLVGRDEALVDEPVELRLENFPARTAVTVSARTVISGTPWASRATFETNDDGTVSLGERGPVEGSYDGADGMGLFWSMSPADGGTTATETATPTGTESTTGTPSATYEVALSASVDGETRVTATTTRRWVAADVSHESVATDDLLGELFVPDGDGPNPGVLVLHGSRGRPMTSVARMLASHGYAAFAVHYFGVTTASTDPIPRALAEIPLSYFAGARSWLTGRRDVQSDGVGVVGASKGGEAALLVGSRYDWVDAVVAYAPSAFVWQATSGAETASWAVDGEPLPYLPFRGDWTTTDRGTTALAPGYRESLERASEARRQSAAIPVENVDAPLLMITGTDDRMWPAALLCREAAERLDANDVAFEYDHRSYEDAGHTISFPYTPTTERTHGVQFAYGGIPSGYARADADSWPRALRTLESGLR